MCPSVHCELEITLYVGISQRSFLVLENPMLLTLIGFILARWCPILFKLLIVPNLSSFIETFPLKHVLDKCFLLLVVAPPEVKTVPKKMEHTFPSVAAMLFQLC